MTDPAREFAVFARYLGMRQPSAAMVAYYARSVAQAAAPTTTAFDRALTRWAARHPAVTALADAYARRVLPYGLLRCRLALVLAILESAPPSFTIMHASDPRPAWRAWIELAACGFRAIGTAIVAVVLFAPLHLVHHLGKRP